MKRTCWFFTAVLVVLIGGGAALAQKADEKPKPEGKAAAPAQVEKKQEPAQPAPAQSAQPAQMTETLKFPSHLGEVEFPHKKHVDDYGTECKKCHHTSDKPEDCTPCTACHEKQGTDKMPDIKVAVHKNCWECHEAGKGAEAAKNCKFCHKGPKLKY